MNRIQSLCALLERAETFADVGCDHGFCSEYMLRHDLCERAIISDISRESLKKAEGLLSTYIAEGRCVPNCADGLAGIPQDTELVLIAGMGGMEMIHILKEGFLPRKFVLQPMRDTEALRRYLVSAGAKITHDVTFEDGKFYDVIKGERAGGSFYTEEEFRFGKGNLALRPKAFLESLAETKRRMLLFLPSLPERERREAEEELARIERVIKA